MVLPVPTKWLLKTVGIADMNTSRDPDQSIGFVEYGSRRAYLDILAWHTYKALLLP